MTASETFEPLRLAARAALDKKAFQLVAFEVSELTSFADAFLLCSAASDRQVGAIANEVRRRLKDDGRRPLHVEGEARSDWVLLDYGDFIVHVFTEEKRAYYALDSLWGDAPRFDVAGLGLADEEAVDRP
jgi:ribosome-associated protein